MTILEYEASLRERLSCLPFAAQVAFAAACAERLAPIRRAFFAHCGEEDSFAELLHLVWTCVKQASLGEVEAELYDEVSEDMPEEGSLPDQAQVIVEYACASVLSAFGFLIGTEENGASDAALCIWETVLILEKDATAENVLANEWSRQEQWLLQLSQWTEDRASELADLVRTTASGDALTYSGSFSF